MERRRVAVTGMGAVSGFGAGVDVLTDSVFAGKSCVRRISGFDPANFPCQIGAECPDFDAPSYFVEPRDARRLEQSILQATAAAKMAVLDSGISFEGDLKTRTGVFIGSGIGGLRTLEEQIMRSAEKGAERISPFFIINAIANMPAGVVAKEWGVHGPCFCVTSACATSGHSIGEAALAIRHGRTDVMIAGGTESALNQVGIGGFSTLKALTFDFNDEPEKGSRPFEKRRSGFVMGEGSGVMILEEWEHAVARNAKIYAEVVGYGASADAYHVTAPPDDGAGAQLAMKWAMEDAGVKREEVTYVNAHGTSTPLNDRAETAAIKAVFGDLAYKLKVSSTKSMHGHLLGAAAAIEGILSIKAFERNELPPTINYEEADPDCDLDYVPNEAVPFHGDYTMCNTFGFGGQNAVLLFRRA
ncbi:MAG: beta-ketoacyl-ACP synthase II [Planctomycetales bacterium]|nr:beta-ketoacyl-ACP synthase II [bacterium]UNM09834.1 MAG: beta-ketoacyl-ACP synthase II [Planctomycetales bacterium]